MPLARIMLRSRRPPAAICQLRLPRTRSAYRSSHSRRASTYGLLSMRRPHRENLELTHQSAASWICWLIKFLADRVQDRVQEALSRKFSALRQSAGTRDLAAASFTVLEKW